MSVVARCVGAKANVLHCVGFVRRDAALLILQKRWHFVFHISVRLQSVVSSFRVRHNGQPYPPCRSDSRHGGYGMLYYVALRLRLPVKT